LPPARSGASGYSIYTLACYIVKHAAIFCMGSLMTSEEHTHSHEHMDHEHEHEHSHDNGHDHDHEAHQGHSHGPAQVTDDNQRRMFWALILTGSFMVVEAVGGFLSGSLALLADAGHMLTDTASLALAWLAFRVAKRPSGENHTYGLVRAEVLAAFVNGLALILITIWIAYEAATRLMEPEPVKGGLMLIVATMGLVVNLVVLYILHRGERGNLNIRGAMLHVMGDLLGSVAAIAAGAVILWTGWMPIDPLLSVLVALLILRSAWHLVRESTHILLEGSPSSPTPLQIQEALGMEVEDLQEVHHIHVWSLTPEHPMVTLHARVAQGADVDQVRRKICEVLRGKFGADHNTVQVEIDDCEDGVCVGVPN
jgi:cobalt-zinc-cadmium efflux system protein